MSYNIGLIGLGVMGQNLALNIERNGYSLSAYDLDPDKQREASNKFVDKNMFTASNLKDFVKDLDSPKRILMMVPAGPPVDAVIEDLKSFLEKGDVLIDGGNSFFANTTERTKRLKLSGIHFIGTGISGGEEGALWQ